MTHSWVVVTRDHLLRAGVSVPGTPFQMRNVRPISRLGWASSRKMLRMPRPCLMSLLVLLALEKSSSTNSCQPKLASPSGFRIQSCPEAELGGGPGWQMQEWHKCDKWADSAPLVPMADINNQSNRISAIRQAFCYSLHALRLRNMLCTQWVLGKCSSASRAY